MCSWQKLQSPEPSPTTEVRSQPWFALHTVLRKAPSCSTLDNHNTTECILTEIFGMLEQQWSVTRRFHYLQSQEYIGSLAFGLATHARCSWCCNILTQCGYSTHCWAVFPAACWAAYPTSVHPSPSSSPLSEKAGQFPGVEGGRISVG